MALPKDPGTFVSRLLFGTNLLGAHDTNCFGLLAFLYYSVKN